MKTVVVPFSFKIFVFICLKKLNGDWFPLLHPSLLNKSSNKKYLTKFKKNKKCPLKLRKNEKWFLLPILLSLMMMKKRMKIQANLLFNGVGLIPLLLLILNLELHQMHLSKRIHLISLLLPLPLPLPLQQKHRPL